MGVPRPISAFAVLTAIFALSAGLVRGQAPQEADKLSLDEILSVNSKVGGETPRWLPDGSGVMFSSGMSGQKGLWTVDANVSTPQQLRASGVADREAGVQLLTEDLGNAGHFLAKQHPTWSPDGDYLAYVRSPEDPNDQSQELWLWSSETEKHTQLTKLSGRINSFSWSPDGRSIAFAGDRYGAYDIWTVSTEDSTVSRLTDGARYEVFPRWTPGGESLLYVRLSEDWTEHTIYEIPATGGRSKRIVRDTGFFDYEAGGEFGYPRPSPDGEQILFRSWRSGWLNYWVVPRDGGKPRPVAQAKAEQSHARWSPNGDQIAFVENHNGTKQLRVVSASGGKPRVLVDPDMGVIGNPEWSPSGDRISYTFETPVQVTDLHVVDVESGDTQQLTTSMPGEDIQDELVRPEKVSYESPDGFSIHGYLYKPPQVTDDTEVPGIMWIHGGPTSQYQDSFQQHVQYVVRQGYAVLMPNIRGSSGYGKEFADANNGCWGHCDLKDVLAGKEFLGSQPYVDSSSSGITGTSYGGCMSMSAIAFAPGAFEASVPMSGYGDWIHFMEEGEMRHLKLLRHEFGDFEENREVYHQNSPIYDVEDVRTPTLLLHGEGYYPGSVASERFAEELKQHYKVYDYKTYPNENYYVYKRENRRQMLLDMRSFFDKYLKDDITDRTE
jgi:dipeptidyl aminopeptidase/acylaminoacyl peptidase